MASCRQFAKGVQSITQKRTTALSCRADPIGPTSRLIVNARRCSLNFESNVAFLLTISDVIQLRLR
jgi:hypothetical protein